MGALLFCTKNLWQMTRQMARNIIAGLLVWDHRWPKFYQQACLCRITDGLQPGYWLCISVKFVWKLCKMWTFQNIVLNLVSLKVGSSVYATECSNPTMNGHICTCGPVTASRNLREWTLRQQLHNAGPHQRAVTKDAIHSTELYLNSKNSKTAVIPVMDYWYQLCGHAKAALWCQRHTCLCRAARITNMVVRRTT